MKYKESNISEVNTNECTLSIIDDGWDCIFVNEIKDTKLIHRIKKRTSLFDEIVERYSASNEIVKGIFMIPYQTERSVSKYGIIEYLYNVANPDHESMGKVPGLILWELILDSPLYKELRDAKIEISYRSVEKLFNLPKKSFISIEYLNGVFYAVSNFDNGNSLKWDDVFNVKGRKSIW